jgi:hypothetical protein
MPPTAFTIKLGEGEKRVSLETLKEALANALEMLRSVSDELAPQGVQVRWEVVAASLRSPLTLTFEPSLRNGKVKQGKRISHKIVSTCVRGVRNLEQGTPPPPYFTEDAILATQKLVKVAQQDGGKVTLAAGRAEKVTPTDRIFEHISAAVEKTRTYLDYGTLEGRLEEISVHGGARIAIWETLTNYKIDCDIPNEALDRIKDLLGKRVAVSGRIRYRNHRPKLITMESIRRLRDKDELPQPENMPPIDITDGEDPAEYVRRMRDAQ